MPESTPLPGPPRPVAPPRVPTPAATQAQSAAPAQAADPSATPETGDLVVDAALTDLAAVDPRDLDEVLAAGDSVHATLTSRLSDLGS